MADPTYFVIPRASLITLPKFFSLNTNNDAFVAFREVRAWSYQQQDRGLVVIIDLLADDSLQYRSIVAYDGPWVNQLLNASTSPTTGLGRVAAGGYYAQFVTPAQITFPVADQWLEISNAVLPLLPYAAAGTNNVTYDTVNNRLRLDWTPPIPTTPTWMQGFAVLTVAATSNNQEYAVAWGVDGAVEPDFQVRFIRENPNDSETVTLHGHRQVPNGTELSLFVKNITGTSPIAVANVNFRFFGDDS